MEYMFPNEKVVLTISNDWYFKKTKLDAYKTQHRGGEGQIESTT